LLKSEPEQSYNTTMVIQRDTTSLMAKHLLPLMLHATPRTARAVEAIKRLREWDGKMERDKVEPLLFIAWLREFNRAVFAERLGPVFMDYWDLNPAVVHAILTDHQEWCDNLGAPDPERCADQLSRSLERALRDLAQRF